LHKSVLYVNIFYEVMQVNETAPTNASGLFLIAAILCTIKATPLLSGMMDGTISMFFTIAVIVISAMILLRPRDPEYTRIPCVTGIIAGLLDTAVYMIGRFQQHTLLGFISDYTFPVNFMEPMQFTERQIEAFGLVMLIAAFSLIFGIFVITSAILYFINYARAKKVEAKA